jgi:hypothetical protein
MSLLGLLTSRAQTMHLKKMSFADVGFGPWIVSVGMKRRNALTY